MWLPASRHARDSRGGASNPETLHSSIPYHFPIPSFPLHFQLYELGHLLAPFYRIRKLRLRRVTQHPRLESQISALM